MTNSPTNSIPNTTSRVNHFTGLARRRRKFSLLPANGDGSTLNLDFTTGVLDPRLTFTRASDATFINSQGFVQYAAVNYFRNTGWTSGTTPTGWNVTFGTGTTTWNADGTLTMTAGGSAVRPCINATSFSVAQGIPFTFGFRVTAVSGSPTIDQVISSTVAGETFSRNGATVSGSTVVQNGDIISCTFTPTTTSNAARMGPGVNVGVTNISITITQPQFNPGTTLQPYYANTSTIAARWDSARFDHDPSTLAPRGLLVEGTSNNLLTYSEDYSQAVWTKATVDRTTGQASPDGGTGATLLSENATTYAKHTIERSQSITAGVHTFSLWVKEPSSNSRRYVCLQLADGQATAARYTIVADLQTGQITASGSTNGTAGAPTNTGHSITPYPGGWYRLTITMNHVSSPSYPAVLLSDISTLFGGNNQPFYSAASPYKGLIVWGAMLEAGSGASSYIPTGASQGTRVQDLVSITSTNFSSWWTSNNPASFLVDISSTNRPLANHIFRIADSSGSAYGYQSYFNNTTMPMQVRAAMSSTTSSDVAIGSNLAANTRTKIGFTVETASLKRFRDGSLANTLNTPTLPPNMLTQMYIGGTSTFGNSSADFHIRQFKYWPITLSDAVMQGLTT